MELSTNHRTYMSQCGMIQPLCHRQGRIDYIERVWQSALTWLIACALRYGINFLQRLPSYADTYFHSCGSQWSYSVCLDNEKCWRWWPALCYLDPVPDNQGQQPGTPIGRASTLLLPPTQYVTLLSNSHPTDAWETGLHCTWCLWCSNRLNNLQWFWAISLILKMAR